MLKPERRVHTARPSTVRDINRSILLNLVRLYQPLSRADLSARTGIVRSNVSEIVDELIAAGLVTETRAVPMGRGRVPFHLTLNGRSFRVVAVNMRAAETTVALSGLTGEIHHSLTFRTPERPAQLVRKIAETVGKIQSSLPRDRRGPFRECGVSAPGMVDARTGQIILLPALPAYNGFPLGAELERRFGVPVAVDNDCNLAALAHLWLSERTAAVRDFVFLEIGEVGVGAGIVLNGELYRGHDGTFAAEFGHMVIDPAGPQCQCGRRGCWELYVSDRATWQRFRPDEEFQPARIAELVAAAAQGDRRAIQAVRRTADYLALGILNIVLALNPQLFVIAGSLGEVWEHVQGSIDEALRAARIQATVRPADRRPAELFLHGAVSLAVAKAFAKPRLGL